MEQWKEYKLGDICKTNISQYSAKENWDNALYLDTGNITDNKINEIVTINDMTHGLPSRARRKVKDKDILFSTVRPNQRHIGILQNPQPNLLVSTGFTVISANQDVADPYFLYYFLSQKEIVDYLHAIAEQAVSAYPSIKASDIEDLDILLPNLSQQKKISKLLKSLDDKIELNRQINDNLEQQAQALFKSWFVDFEPFKDGEFIDSELGMIPKGWRVGNIFDIANIFDSQRKPLSSGQREKMDKIYPYYGATSCMDYVDNYIFDGIYTLIGEDGSVVRDNGLPFVQYVWGKFWVNNHAHILQGKNGFSTEMIYTFLSTTNICHLVTGAVQAKLSQANMNKLYLPIPPENLVEKIKCIFDEIFKNKRLLIEEINTLTTIRDTLLPRLMSGELKINEINC